MGWRQKVESWMEVVVEMGVCGSRWCRKGRAGSGPRCVDVTLRVSGQDASAVDPGAFCGG